MKVIKVIPVLTLLLSFLQNAFGQKDSVSITKMGSILSYYKKRISDTGYFKSNIDKEKVFFMDNNPFFYEEVTQNEGNEDFKGDLVSEQKDHYTKVVTTNSLVANGLLSPYINSYRKNILSGRSSDTMFLSLCLFDYSYTGKKETLTYFRAIPSKTYSKGSKLKIYLPKDLQFTLSKKSIKRIYVAFNDGTKWRPIRPGHTMSIDLNTLVTKLTFIVSGANGERFSTTYDLLRTAPEKQKTAGVSKDKKPNGPCKCGFKYQKYTPWDKKINITAKNFVRKYDSPFYRLENNPSRYRKPAEMTLFIKYSCKNNGKLIKPFVIVDGISFNTIRLEEHAYTAESFFRQGDNPQTGAPNCYKRAETHIAYDNFLRDYPDLVQFVGFRTINWATIVSGIDAEGWVAKPRDPSYIEKFPVLLDSLCERGYDIVFADYYNAEYYIENNSIALKQALDSIHSLMPKDTDARITVCGASMGGLVTRYALNMLQSEGHIDWIDRFISFDSPQLGANIPLSVQQFLKSMSGLSPSAELLYDRVTCPAASQLVSYSILESDDNIALPSKERDSLLMGRFMGWPMCRKVSIVNGSVLGTLQDSLELHSTHNPLTSQLRSGQTSLNTNALVSVEMRALPTTTGRARILKITGIPFVGTTYASNTVPLDNMGGSYRWTWKDVYYQLDEAFYTRDIFADIKYYKHCFIPTMSGLGSKEFERGIMPEKTDLHSLFTNGRYVDTVNKYSYFDVLYAPDKNQGHIEITDQNIGWILFELSQPRTLPRQGIPAKLKGASK